MLALQSDALAGSGSCITLQLAVLKILKEDIMENCAVQRAELFYINVNKCMRSVFKSGNLHRVTESTREFSTIFLHKQFFNLDSIHPSSMRQNAEKVGGPWLRFTFAL